MDILKKIKPMKLARFLRVNPQFFFDVACYHISKFFKAKIDDKLIVLGGAHGTAFMGNTKYLYKFLKKNTDYKLVWVYKSQELRKELEKQGIKSVYRYSLEAIKTLRRARAVFVTHGYSDILPVKLSPRTVVIETWHGADIKIIDNHPYWKRYIDSVKSRLALTRLRDQDFFDYIITPSNAKKPRKIIKKVFHLPPERILSIGYPKNDILHLKNSNFLNELRKLYHIPNSIKRIILYAPTYRENFTTKEAFNSEELIKLNKFCEETDSLFLFKAHISEEVIKVRNLKKLLVVRKDADIQELLLISDILITDYSSVYCDFLLLNRPILLYTYDYEEYMGGRGLYYDNFEDVAPGPLLYTVNELIDAIRNIRDIKKDYETKALKLNNYFNRYKDGKSSERLLNFLTLT